MVALSVQAWWIRTYAPSVARGTVPGLVGDGTVAGAAEMGVGDEADAQVVRDVRVGVQAGAGDL